MCDISYSIPTYNTSLLAGAFPSTLYARMPVTMGLRKYVSKMEKI